MRFGARAAAIVYSIGTVTLLPPRRSLEDPTWEAIVRRQSLSMYSARALIRLGAGSSLKTVGSSRLSSTLERTEDSSAKVSGEMILGARLFAKKAFAAERNGSLDAYAAIRTPVST